MIFIYIYSLNLSIFVWEDFLLAKDSSKLYTFCVQNDLSLHFALFVSLV